MLCASAGRQMGEKVVSGGDGFVIFFLANRYLTANKGVIIL